MVPRLPSMMMETNKFTLPFTYHPISIQNNMKAGSKFGTGRPATGRTYAISVRISREAAEILSTKKNKSEYIDGLIRNDRSQG